MLKKKFHMYKFGIFMVVKFISPCLKLNKGYFYIYLLLLSEYCRSHLIFEVLLYKCETCYGITYDVIS